MVLFFLYYIGKPSTPVHVNPRYNTTYTAVHVSCTIGTEVLKATLHTRTDIDNDDSFITYQIKNIYVCGKGPLELVYLLFDPTFSFLRY
jgi:hypothetical protein